MNADQSAPSSHQPSAAALAKPLPSNRACPFTPATAAAASATTAVDAGDMAATGFLPMSQPFRPLPPAQSPYPLNMSTAHLLERDPAQPVGAPFSRSPSSPMVRVLIRRLPLNTSEESLRLMVVWSKELANVELLPVDKSEDEGFRSALLRFRTIAGAMEAKNMLDGRANISNDAEMIVEILASSPVSARRRVADAPPSSAAASAASSAAPGSRQPSRFNGVFSPMDNMSPTSHGAFAAAHDFLSKDPGVSYQSIFSPQSPIGSHLADRNRTSGKALISNDLGDDDETSDLLKDPVAYAENGASSQRRATAPQIPVGRMAGLSLNTSNPPGPSSLPQYMTPLSPINGSGPAGLTYPVAGHGYQPRHNFPPVNPADQNPPCNTLYVGNLPIDTSEEELKAMFSKQRGYKRLCFRTKQNGPMCFVEFEDISFATKALHELYGHPLHNSVKGGIRLSFSKNPLGVRSGQAPGGQGSSGSAGGINAVMGGAANGFTTAHGPPPGLSAPPGLGTGRGGNYNLATSMNTGGNLAHQTAAVSGFPGGPSHPWNLPVYNSGVAAGPHAPLHANSPYLSRHMMGK